MRDHGGRDAARAAAGRGTVGEDLVDELREGRGVGRVERAGDPGRTRRRPRTRARRRRQQQTSLRGQRVQAEDRRRVRGIDLRLPRRRGQKVLGALLGMIRQPAARALQHQQRALGREKPLELGRGDGPVQGGIVENRQAHVDGVEAVHRDAAGA